MAAIITEKFRLHNAEQFQESFSEAAKSTYYLFIGKSSPFTTSTSGGNDNAPPTPKDDITTEFYKWDSMLAAKLISSSDVSYVIPRRNWANNTTYDMYEHDISSSNTTTSGATNLYDSTFHFMTSDYRVYKVLDNNGGIAYSGAEPTSTVSSPFELGGYTLQYMYTLSTSQIQKFVTSDFIPVTTDTTVSGDAADGSIDTVRVVAGSGYTDGTYYSAIDGDGANGIVEIKVSGNSIVKQGSRSEEHTSELQSRLHLVCRLLLEKKNTRKRKEENLDDNQGRTHMARGFWCCRNNIVCRRILWLDD